MSLLRVVTICHDGDAISNTTMVCALADERIFLTGPSQNQQKAGALETAMRRSGGTNASQPQARSALLGACIQHIFGMT